MGILGNDLISIIKRDEDLNPDRLTLLCGANRKTPERFSFAFETKDRRNMNHAKIRLSISEQNFVNSDSFTPYIQANMSPEIFGF